MVGSGLKPYAWLGLVISLSVAAYAVSLHGPFHYDDYHTIVLNPRIKDAANIPRFFISPGMDSGFVTGGYRPVVTASLAINYAVSGLSTWSYHAFNVIFHLACVLVVFLLARNFAGKAGQGPYTAVLAAGIFALHPVHTSAVSYIIARSAVLCTFFYTLSFYAYVRFKDREGGGGRWLSLSFASFILALLSKELAVTLPVAMLLYDFLVMKERRLRGYAYGTLYLLAAAAYTALKVYLLSPPSGDEALYSSPSLLMAQPYVLAGYLRLFLLPVNLNFYPDILPPATYTNPAFLIPALALAVLPCLVVYHSGRHPLAAFCLAWFFVALIPETFANLRERLLEYRLYLPSVGLSLFAGTCAAPLFRTAHLRRKAVVICLVLLGCFFVLTVERNRLFNDDIALWRDTVRKSPGSAVAESILGESYMRAKRYREAVEHLSRAVKLDPLLFGAATAYNNLGWSLEQSGDYDKAIAAYETGLSLDESNMDLLLNLWTLCNNLGRSGEAYIYVKEAARQDPDNAFLRSMVADAERAARAKSAGGPGK